VFVSFNPEGYSYFHWVSGGWADNVPLKVLAGIALLILYIIFLRATWRSIGPIGVGLAVAFFGAIVWSLFYYDLLTLGQHKVITYIVLVLIASVMAVGLSWSHIRRRLSGQVDSDIVDE
jgi:hypothetical protein